MRQYLIILAVALSIGGSAFAEQTMDPVAMNETVKAQAKVVSVNKKTREIKLKMEDGEETSMIAGPEVRNFDQIKKGDTLTVSYMESLVWQIKRGSDAPVMVNETTDMNRSAIGQKPGMTVTNQVKVVGAITKVNTKDQTITLKGPSRSVVLKVPKDDVFKRMKVGDKIEATFTEAVALSVETIKK